MSIVSDNKRLVLEHAAMRERWGDAPRLCRDQSERHFWWEVPLRVEGNTFPIKIVYPDDYPASPPDIIPLMDLPVGTPHLLPGREIGQRRLCWIYPGETKRNRNKWNPAQDTAALAVGVAYRWFLALLVWDATGEWPVPDALS